MRSANKEIKCGVCGSTKKSTFENGRMDVLTV